MTCHPWWNSFRLVGKSVKRALADFDTGDVQRLVDDFVSQDVLPGIVMCLEVSGSSTGGGGAVNEVRCNAVKLLTKLAEYSEVCTELQQLVPRPVVSISDQRAAYPPRVRCSRGRRQTCTSRQPFRAAAAARRCGPHPYPHSVVAETDPNGGWKLTMLGVIFARPKHSSQAARRQGGRGDGAPDTGAGGGLVRGD